MVIHQCFLTKNDCYIRNVSEKKLPSNEQDYRYREYFKGPRGIVVHSTGANNPYIKRYVQPDDGKLGTNRYNNDWNRSGLDDCVHAFIGRLQNDDIAVYQTLPWDFRCWGVGSGRNGSYNNSHIQFEICEDDLTDPSYCKATFEEAAQLCAYLCKKFNIPVSSVVSHHEAYQQGYGSGHVDPDNWWPKHNLSMNTLRNRIQEIINKEEQDMERSEMEKIAKNAADSAIKELMNGVGSGDNNSKYSEEATNWAKENGLILGIGNGDYAWKTPMTREEMVTLLYRFYKMTNK